MAIENRNLEVGTRLVGRYKGKTTVCLVEEKEGETVFKLEGQDKAYKSLSSAATEITKGPINGWKFWSVEGAEAAPAKASGAKARSPKPQAKKRQSGRQRQKPATKVIHLHENQEDLPEGQARYWCHACMGSFLAFEEPTQCPEGHRIDDPELNSTDEGATE